MVLLQEQGDCCARREALPNFLSGMAGKRCTAPQYIRPYLFYVNEIMPNGLGK